MYNSFIIKSDTALSVQNTIFSGQSFLWNTCQCNCVYFSSIIDGVPLFIRQISDFEFEVNADVKEINSTLLSVVIRDYFMLDIAVENVFPEEFSRFYPELWQLLQKYFTLRILKQDPFETMISFMCAQGIGMHLIRQQVAMLTKKYGEKTTTYFEGRNIDLYNFPTPLRLAEADPFVMCRCTNNNRARAANIILASRNVAEGRIDFEHLRNREIPLSELRIILSQQSGIGFKIADCIALFSLGRLDAFPIDTHVKQYLRKWFGSTTALRSLSPATYLALDAEARSFLNPELAGYAGHILFHCWRMEVKKMRSF